MCFVGKQPRIAVTQIWLSSCLFKKLFSDSVKLNEGSWVIIMHVELGMVFILPKSINNTRGVSDDGLVVREVT